MNARLRLKLIQSQAGTKPAAKPEPPQIRLLGEGLDAIIQHTSRPNYGLMHFLFPAGTPDRTLPWRPNDQSRLERYRIAFALWAGGSREDVERRAMFGELLQRAWQNGKWPRLRGGGLLLAAARIKRACRRISA